MELDPKGYKPEQIAATQYSTLINKARELFKNLSKHEKDRVLYAILEVPFEENKPQFLHREEEMCYNVIERMQTCKIMMLIAILETNPNFVDMFKTMFNPNKEEKMQDGKQEKMDQSRNSIEEEKR
jgi:hypothetical protein